MVLCFICKQTFSTVKILIKHFQYKHFSHNFSIYYCAEKDCNRSFHLLNSFKKHLSSHIKHLTVESTCKNYLIGSQSLSTSNPICIANSSNVNDNIPQLSNAERAQPELPINKFVSSLYSNAQIPRNVVQEVMDGVNEIITGITNTLKKSIIEFSAAKNEIQCEDFYEYFNYEINKIDKAFANLDTEYKRFKYFTELGTYIPPQEYVIGQRLNESTRSNRFSITPINCTQQLIPIRFVLKNFFQMKNILSDTLKYINDIKHCDTILINFIQGSVWKEKQIEHGSQCVLPIFLFFDDYEVGNPLGSHSGIHKLGAVYISIPCLPPHIQSTLKTIFLALIFHSADRQKFGNSIIFKPLIDELNFLKEQGIDIEIDGEFKSNIKFELGLILGDNLGLHSITGFVESFSSNFPCRMCKVSKEVMIKQCYVDEKLTRQIDNYNFDVIENNMSNSGIKELCVWNDVKGFKVLDQVGVDLMHDLLEGVIKYDLSFLISYYILELKLFSLEVLNHRLINFDYGPDKSNKPCILNMDHIRKNTIRLSASEIMSLVRYFGLLIGDFVPQNEPVWDIYISIRKILDILTSISLQKECSKLLQTLVAEHNELYLMFSKNNLKPKYHYLLHYHTMIMKFGPLIHLWSMRYEAKHRISKISANSSSNRRNICKTLAIKHQLQLNYLFLKGSIGEIIKVGPPQSILDVDSIINEIKIYTKIESFDSVLKYPWINIKGTQYQPKMAMTLYINEMELPTFCLINEIFVCNNNQVVFLCFQLNTIMFNEHFFAYEIEVENNKKIFVSYDSLLSSIPNNINTVSSGKRYVTVRGGL